MLRKLAIRNAKRSIKDYLVYLITVIMSFSLIIAFNLIVYSKDVRELSSMTSCYRSQCASSVCNWLVNQLYNEIYAFEEEQRIWNIYNCSR